MNKNFYIVLCIVFISQTKIFCSSSSEKTSMLETETNHAVIIKAIDIYLCAIDEYKNTVGYFEYIKESVKIRLAEFDFQNDYIFRRATEPYFGITPVTNDKVDAGLKKRRDLIETEVIKAKRNLDKALADLETARDRLYAAAGRENIRIQKDQTLIQETSHEWISLEEYKRKHEKKHHGRRHPSECTIQ